MFFDYIRLRFVLSCCLVDFLLFLALYLFTTHVSLTCCINRSYCEWNVWYQFLWQKILSHKVTGCYTMKSESYYFRFLEFLNIKTQITDRKCFVLCDLWFTEIDMRIFHHFTKSKIYQRI